MAKKIKRGRPAGLKLPHNMLLRVDDAFYTALDDWRRKQPDLPTRAEAVRRLVLSVKKKS